MIPAVSGLSEAPQAASAPIAPDTELGRALRTARAALIEQPEHLGTWLQYLHLAYLTGHVEHAIETILAAVPGVALPEPIFLPLARILHYNGLHDEAVRIFEAILKTQPDARQTHSDYLIHKQLSGLDDADALAEYARWNDRFVKPIAQRSRRAETDKQLNRQLHIGLVANDFAGGHSLNASMAPWMPREKNPDFTYCLYANSPPAMKVHPVFEANADSLVNVFDLSDEALNQRIRADGIDILVDMCGHMDHNRLLTYARKPAPIVVSWIGIGIPTGVEAVAYFVADRHRVPPGTIKDYREKVVFLPGAGMPWLPPYKTPDVRPAPYFRNGFVTFGNLSRIVKIQKETVDLWANVLHAVPGSKFCLTDVRMGGMNFRRISDLFAVAGVPPERLILKSETAQFEHLSAYNDLDIVLDTYPQHGGISTLEATWMGVPTVSYQWSQRTTCHVASWIMGEVGLPELIASSPRKFVEIARTLSGHMEMLNSIRSGLRHRLLASPICDHKRFRCSLYAAFREMWRRYCLGLPAESFSVGNPAGETAAKRSA
jgi:predicted O-linked N-acetylglucosamine transferase (SPINDLY family)